MNQNLLQTTLSPDKISIAETDLALHAAPNLFIEFSDGGAGDGN